MGQLLRLDIDGFSFPVIDIFIVLLALTTPKSKPQNKPLLFFIIFAWVGLLVNHPHLESFLYLIRLTCLLSLFTYPPQIPPRFKRLLILALIANIVFGLIQYLFWPDFTYFKALSWDDHLNRLVSTYFDPTFTGLIYLMFLIYIEFSKDSFSRFTFYVLRFTTYIAIALTYSRSTFLSLFICLLFIALKTKKIIVPFVFSFVFCVLILLLPRSPGEGTKLERTSSINAKIINYQEAVATFLKSPLIGHGYNNLPTIRQLDNNHSRGGFDSSLLTILATTGILGFGLWALGFIQIFRQSSPFKQTLLIAILVHSLFANSLLYPWILVLFVFF